MGETAETKVAERGTTMTIDVMIGEDGDHDEYMSVIFSESQKDRVIEACVANGWELAELLAAAGLHITSENVDEVISQLHGVCGQLGYSPEWFGESMRRVREAVAKGQKVFIG